MVKWKAEMDELEKKENQRLAEEKKKNYESNRVTDVERDIEQAV